MLSFPWFKKKLPNTGGRHAAEPIYSWHQGRIFNNGAQQVAFEFGKALPLYSIIGPATIAGALMIDQPPQVFNPQSVPVVGLGGIQAGGFTSQPLVNADFSPIQ